MPGPYKHELIAVRKAFGHFVEGFAKYKGQSVMVFLHGIHIDPLLENHL
jgi:hypothetical protein